MVTQFKVSVHLVRVFFLFLFHILRRSGNIYYIRHFDYICVSQRPSCVDLSGILGVIKVSITTWDMCVVFASVSMLMGAMYICVCGKWCIIVDVWVCAYMWRLETSNPVPEQLIHRNLPITSDVLKGRQHWQPVIWPQDDHRVYASQRQNHQIADRGCSSSSLSLSLFVIWWDQ